MRPVSPLELSLFSAYAELRAEREAAISVASAGWQSPQFNEKSERAQFERVHGGCTERSRSAMRVTADKVLTICHRDLQLAQ